MLVLGALGWGNRKETDGTNLFCQSDCETIGILEDEDDDEDEDDSSSPEFRINPQKITSGAAGPNRRAHCGLEISKLRICERCRLQTPEHVTNYQDIVTETLITNPMQPGRLL